MDILVFYKRWACLKTTYELALYRLVACTWLGLARNKDSTLSGIVCLLRPFVQYLQHNALTVP